MAGQSNAERNQEEQELHQQLADLKATLARFHDEVSVNPAVWHDPKTVGAAWGTVRLIGSVEQNLQILWIRDMRRRQAQAVTANAELVARTAEEASVDPVHLHILRFAEAEGTMIHAMTRLRRATDGAATHLQDLQRRVLLRSLLDILHDVQPMVAQDIEGALAQARQHGGHLPDYVERWERRTIDGLIRLLEPLLEDRLP